MREYHIQPRMEHGMTDAKGFDVCLCRTAFPDRLFLDDQDGLKKAILRSDGTRWRLKFCSRYKRWPIDVPDHSSEVTQ